VHLADDRLAAVEQAHEALRVAAHHRVVDHRIPRAARIVVRRHHRRVKRRATRRQAICGTRPLATLIYIRSAGRCGSPGLAPDPLCALDEVVASAEARPGPRKQQRVHRRIEVRAPHALDEPRDERRRDSVSARWAVERDPRDAIGDLVEHDRLIAHALIL
jgi:hypothetical protein